ncbi:MAG: chemotaxis protein CheW, partial [Campylobacterota bacterium]|nr:chemotaxis protein CheW [Campylobacterota bacterium]
SVGENKYAMNIANVQRIIQAETLTDIPNAHVHIDGMMSYEDKVIKVLNFRKLIGIETYENELTELFVTLKQAHSAWVEALKLSIQTGVKFTKTLDPHACGLGKWIDSFIAYDDHIIEILNELSDFHKQLHSTGGVALNKYEDDKEESLRILNEDIANIYSYAMSSLDKFVNELSLVANSLQKLIIYDNDGVLFAIKVDKIEDIAHVQESEFINAGEEHDVNEFLELEGVLDLDDILINVIKTVVLPK